MQSSSATPRIVRLALVDDHPLVRDGLRARLESVPGFKVVGEAGDREEALAMIGATEPDVALLDLSLGRGGGSGIDLAREVSARWPRVRIVILTMHLSPGHVIESLRAGAHGYVLKDSPATEIVEAIRAVTDGQRFLSPLAAGAMATGVAVEPDLTEREQEILSLLAEGLSSKQMARKLDLSVRTVESHRLNIKRKLGVAGSAALVRYAVDWKASRR